MTVLDQGPPPSSRELAVLEAAGIWTGPDILDARRAALERQRSAAMETVAAARLDADLLEACATLDDWERRFLATDFEVAGDDTPEGQTEAASNGAAAKRSIRR